MGVSLKTENEDSAGETVQERGSKGGRRGFTGTSRIDLAWIVPRTISARLTDCPKLNTVVWQLRCSVLRETPMPDAHEVFKTLNCYGKSNFVDKKTKIASLTRVPLALGLVFSL
jgi:hypothetical protein